jgi:Family of unknown function (DUF6879)
VQGYLVGEGRAPGRAAPPDGETQVEMPRETFLRLASELARHDAPAPNSLLGTFQRSAFRMETLPVYSVEAEAERFGAFLAGQSLPPRSPENSSWLRRVAESTKRGIFWRRVHLLRQPLSDYLRYELLEYQANVAAGEDIRIVDITHHPELANVNEDFWLLDADQPTAYAMLMQYDRDGQWTGAWRTSDSEVVRRCRQERDLAIQASITLSEYLLSTNLLKPVSSPV